MEMSISQTRRGLTWLSFSDLDMARTDFILQHFPAAVLGTRQYVALGAIAATFQREIAPYEAYTIETRVFLDHSSCPSLCRLIMWQIFAWTEKWIFLQSRFVGPKGDARAQSLAQYVIKAGRRTVKPETSKYHCIVCFSVDDVRTMLTCISHTRVWVGSNTRHAGKEQGQCSSG